MTCHMTEGGCSAEHMIILCCSHSYFVSCDYLQIGNGAGTGYNVNIAFSGQRIQNGSHFPSCCGDTEYLAAFRLVD